MPGISRVGGIGSHALATTSGDAGRRESGALATDDMKTTLILERDHLNVELQELKDTARSISPKLALHAKTIERIQNIATRLGVIAEEIRKAEKILESV